MPSSAGDSSWKAALSLLLGLALWEAGSRSGLLSAVIFPPPTRVLARLLEACASGSVLRQLSPTLLRFLAGSLAGALLGACAGLLCGFSKPLDSILRPWIDATFPLPKIALIPLLMALLGAGELLSVSLIAISVFYPMAISIRNGVLETDPSLLDAARNLGATRAQVVAKVVLPSLTPYAFTGLHLGLLTGLATTIVVELLLSSQGIGRMLWVSGEWLRMDVYYAYIVLLALTGMLVLFLLRRAMKRFVPWAVK